MKSREYLEEIRKRPALERAVLRKITLSGNRAIFYLVTDMSYTEEDIRCAAEVSARYVPAGFTADVNLKKSIPDEETVQKAVAEILKNRFPAAAAFISPQDIAVSIDKSGGRFSIGADTTESKQFFAGNIIDAVGAELQKNFCGAWTGGLVFKEKEKGEIEHDAPPPPEFVVAPRCFPIAEYEAIDGGKPEYAVYIADLKGGETNTCICGTVTYIEERETKNGKPWFSISISDGSGQMRTSYFSKKATIEKARSLKQGDNICLSGDYEEYNGGFSFRVRALDFGQPPREYVWETRPSRPAPAVYKAVFPQPETDYVQATLFGGTPLPEDFVKENFVVFDLETTGLNNSPVSGAVDRIIEIGAVKIQNGRIVEKFSSFVACPVRLSMEIINLTGIDDHMLIGAPKTEDVIADFRKFSDGCILVGHNVQFDYKFIRYYGEKDGYNFEQRQLDTLTLAQEQLRLSNYKLNTVADHFGFTFNHHRAYDDAYVTAKVFIELIRLKGRLP